MKYVIATFQALILFLFAGWACAEEPIGTPDPNNIEYPDEEEPTEAQILLGKTLFFDTRLYINQRQSCATCHNPELGFGDGMNLGVGTKGKVLGRHTPSLYNLAWNVVFFWDGRASSLEKQALGPIEAEGEMAMPIDMLIGRLSKVDGYKKLFEAAYPTQGIHAETIASAIASFERSIITNNSPFDRYMAGDKNAMTESEIRGMELFKGKARCIKCHDGPNFTDNSYHNIGLKGNDQGRGVIAKDPSLNGAFKTPGLRNIALHAPYMHDGSEGSLEDVVRLYNRGGDNKDNLSSFIKKLDLTDEEIFDLVAFMGALTDPVKIDRPQIP